MSKLKTETKSFLSARVVADISTNQPFFDEKISRSKEFRLGWVSSGVDNDNDDNIDDNGDNDNDDNDNDDDDDVDNGDNNENDGTGDFLVKWRFPE